MSSPSLRILGLSIAIVVLGSTLAFADEKPAPKPGSTEAVLAHHINSFILAVTEDKAKGIAGVLEDYTEDSAIHTPEKSFRGLAEVEAFITGLVEGMPTFMEGFEMIRQEIDGDIAYIVWKNHLIALATDTFVVKNGKIMTQTFAGYMAPQEDAHEGHGH